MCPYVGESLVDLFGTANTVPPTERMLRDVADAGGRAMTEAAKADTPVRSGRTRDSLQQVPTEKIVGGYRSGVESHYWRARFVEHGVQAHDIRPKGKKALDTPHGPRAGARSPGHAGAHMVARAALEIEAALPTIAEPHLTRWAAEIERRGS